MLFLKILVFPIMIFSANLLVFARNEAPEGKRYIDDPNNIGRHITATLIAVSIGILIVK